MFLNCIGRQTISSKFRFQKPPLKSPLIRRIAPPQVLILLLVLPLVLHFSVVFAATFGTVDAIEITGNNKTKPVAILQELSFKPGDKLTEKQLRDSEQAVKNMGLFKAVELLPAKHNGKLVVAVNVEEKRCNDNLTLPG